MNILKNMEIIFVAALAIACSAAYVGPAPDARAAQAGAALAAQSMPVVVVHAKRLTALEKQQSLAQEELAMTSQRAGAL